MPTQPVPDNELEQTADGPLRLRLGRMDFTHPEFVPDEQALRLLRHALSSDATARSALISNAITRRLLKRSASFVIRSKIFPRQIPDFEHACRELSYYIWMCLIERPKDWAFGEKYFGRLFNRRAMDFRRRRVAEGLSQEVSLDAMSYTADDDEDPECTAREIVALQRETTPEQALASKQEVAAALQRLEHLLTSEEYSVLMMLRVEGMLVKDIAKALKVTPRTVNNYKRAALEKVEKVRKEFQQ